MNQNVSSESSVSGTVGPGRATAASREELLSSSSNPDMDEKKKGSHVHLSIYRLAEMMEELFAGVSQAKTSKAIDAFLSQRKKRTISIERPINFRQEFKGNQQVRDSANAGRINGGSSESKKSYFKGDPVYRALESRRTELVGLVKTEADNAKRKSLADDLSYTVGQIKAAKSVLKSGRKPSIDDYPTRSKSRTE